MRQKSKKKLVFFNTALTTVCIFFILGSLWPWRVFVKSVFFAPTDDQLPLTTVVLPLSQEVGQEKTVVAGKEIIATSSFGEQEKMSGENAVPVLTETVLPKEINLDVPFTSQAPEKNWDQPWQDACEEAAVLMLAAYYNGYNLSPLFAKDEILKMIAWEETQGWGGSLDYEKVVQLIHWYAGKNWSVRVVENPTTEMIKEWLAQGRPVLALTYGKDLPNPYFRNGGPEYHALIIRGYTSEKFITNDPGSGWSKNYAYPYDVFLNAVHDWNGGKVKEGKKIVIILE